MRFPGQLFVFFQNLAYGIKPAERRQMYIRKRLLNFQHPAFDGPLHADRHLTRDNLYQIRWNRCSSQEVTRLSLIYAQSLE
jgi:hypothetical protein